MALIGLQEDLIRKSYSKKNSVPEEDQSFDLNLNKNMNRNLDIDMDMNKSLDLNKGFEKNARRSMSG